MSFSDTAFHERYFEDDDAATYALVIFLPRDLDRFTVPLREKYDPIHRAIPSHICIVFPFQHNGPVDDLAAQIGEELEHAPAFSIELDSIGDFYPKVPVIYWKVRENQMLSTMYYKISARLQLPLPHRQYIPHVTIAREISSHRVLLVKEKIVPYLPTESFMCRKIDLITTLPGNRWVSVRTFTLSEY